MGRLHLSEAMLSYLRNYSMNFDEILCSTLNTVGEIQIDPIMRGGKR
jgi:hypothetical protein